jgi:hypothetical protein
MPTVRAIPTGSGFPQDAHVDMRLKIVYKRDGVDNNNNAIVNLRNDSAFYPANGWQNVSLNEAWNVDFGNDICGGTAYLFYRHDDGRTDTIIFYIRGTNPTETQIRNYLTQQGYNYWFFMKMTRQESSLLQFGNFGNYTTTWQTGNTNRRGEPLYGPPRGFGLKQLDNWGAPRRYATSKHLWNWQANIDGGVEVIREKEGLVNSYRDNYNRIINSWNRVNQDDLISDSLNIVAGEGVGTRVLTITEGNEIFVVTPTGNQHDIYDALWIKLFNGGERYYRVIEPSPINEILQKPVRIINRINTLNRNYVHNVCGQQD